MKGSTNRRAGVESVLVLLAIAIGVCIVAGIWQIGGWIGDRRRARRRRREIDDLRRLYDSSGE